MPTDETRLYRIEWSGFCYVRATSQEDAEIASAMGASEELVTDASPVSNLNGVDAEWLDCLPWMSERTESLRLPELTCAQVMERYEVVE